MKEIAYEEKARDDVRRIRKFYESRWPAVRSALQTTLTHIRIFPYTGSAIGDKRRTVCRVSRRLRFNIYYRVSGNAIIVSAIVPGALDQ